ncbi:MAG: hypothetical protein ALECFALPRED_006704 [Alectoria fallacina]|uniref:Aminoglycoside phosphotransferase domain-containing protein n=1 Tax=Alectoria fallacina TaxID=1903189 RepID=A0A8H3IZ97_9LECA|nr:MAG: hypothetical protein ALECFALPRED_006704 [Alectoria fallacina]
MTSKPAAEAQDARSDAPNMTTLTLLDMKNEAPRSPTPSDNDSIHSCSDFSDTSTLKYDQELYNLFKVRVEKLCESLWPPRRSIMQYLSNSKLATRMRANGFFRLFVPSPIQEGPLIERLKGGDYNRITGITLPSTKGEGDRNRNLILRVPRWGQGRTERVAATLDYVRQSSLILVATIIAKDFSSDNPLKSPYVLQSRIPGCNLEVLWTDLSHSQRCTVAREIGRVIRGLMTLESPLTGHVEASSRDTETAELYTVVPFDLKNVDGDLFEEPEQQSSQVTGVPRVSQTTLDFFKCQIGRWRAVDVDRNAAMVDRTIGLWDGMLKVVEEMNDLGIFPAERHCLCHVDLHPRNIMVEVQPDGSLQVTGILDWDEAVVAPKFMACEPPGWLWGYDPDDVQHDGVLTWPYEMPGANDAPSTLAKQELKRILEDCAGPDYLSLAYGEQFRMSRGLFRIAMFGLTSSENYSAADRIIGDWQRLRHSLTQ